METTFGPLVEHLSKQSKSKETPHLVQATIELTYGCNLNCVHCYNPTHKARGEMTTEQVFRIIDQLVGEGCLWLSFSGGELFTRRDCLEVMRYAQERGCVLSILTNATLISPEIIEALESLSMVQINVSIYGATKETYEAATRSPGAFEKFVKGMDLLAGSRLNVLCNLIIMTVNYHELDPMKQFCRDRNLGYRIDTEMHPKVADGDLTPYQYRITPEQSFKIWKDITGDIKKKELEVEKTHSCGSAQGENSSDLYNCMCGKTSAAVTPYGKLNLCISMYKPEYDLLNGSVSEGWPRLVDLVKGAKAGPDYECHRCDLADICTRGTMDSYMEFRKDDVGCISYFRQVAEKKAEYLGIDSLKNKT